MTRTAPRPLRFRGLEGLFLGILVLVAVAAFGLTVHRHIVEERTRSVTLLVRVDDYMDMLERSGVPFERGFDALLKIGVHAVAAGGATLESLERRGAVTTVTARELLRLKRMSGAFPELVLNAPGFFNELPPNGLAVLSGDADLLKRLELSIAQGEGREGTRLAQASADSGGTLSVLLVPNAGESLRRESLIEDAESLFLLRKMGFRIYHDLDANGGRLPLEIRGNLARSIERDRIAGVMFRAPEPGRVSPGAAALEEFARRREEFPGTAIVVAGEPPLTPLAFPPWMRRLAANLQTAREMRSFDEPLGGFLARGAARILVLPVRGFEFERFRDEGRAFAAALRAAGYNLGERKGATPIGPSTGAFVGCLFLLTLACLATLRRRLAPGPLVLALYVVLLIVLVPLFPALDRMGLVEPLKFPLSLAFAALLSTLPFLVERLHRFQDGGAGRGLLVPLFQTLSAAVWFTVLLPLPLALLYDPYHLALPPTRGFRTAALLSVALAALLSPLFSGRVRSRLAARILDRPLTARGLAAFAGTGALLAAALAVGETGAASGAASWWRGASEALLTVPLLTLYFAALHASRLRTSWLLAPLAAVAAGGPAFDLVFDPAAPVLVTLSAVLRAYAFGLVASVLYAALAARAHAALAAREVRP